MRIARAYYLCLKTEGGDPWVAQESLRAGRDQRPLGASFNLYTVAITDHVNGTHLVSAEQPLLFSQIAEQRHDVGVGVSPPVSDVAL